MKNVSFVFFVLLAVGILISCGCRSLKPDHSQHLDFKSDHERQIDSLWRQGYGFGNPNPDRIRNGLEPVNFDGSTESESLGRSLGNLVLKSVFDVLLRR